MFNEPCFYSEIKYTLSKSSFINSCNHVCPSRWLHHPVLAQSVLYSGGDNMSVSSQVQRRLFFFNFFIYPGRTFAKSGGLRSHWSAPWCECVYTNSSLNSTGAVSAVKTVVADGILNQWPAGVEPTLFSDLSATSIFAPLRAGLAHQSCGNTGSVSTDILKYQCREHDALLSTNYVVLRVYLWHW